MINNIEEASFVESIVLHKNGLITLHFKQDYIKYNLIEQGKQN